MTLNFKDFLKSRALSWSAINSFEYNPEQWYSKYILNEKSPENEAMKYGKIFGERLATDSMYLPDVPRYSVFEQKLSVVFQQIPIIGFIDSYDPLTHSIIEYKTSKELWSKDKADNHGQLHLYALAIYITHKKLPEKINLVCIKTKESGDFSVSIEEPLNMVNHSVDISMRDILFMGTRILKVVKGMEEYVKNLSTPSPLHTNYDKL